jgi:hypothetical protein
MALQYLLQKFPQISKATIKEEEETPPSVNFLGTEKQTKTNRILKTVSYKNPE